jgi:hypothetical protein
MTTMPLAATMAMAGQRTDKWDSDNASRTTMISSIKMKTTINKKYDEGGWIRFPPGDAAHENW